MKVQLLTVGALVAMLSGCGFGDDAGDAGRADDGGTKAVASPVASFLGEEADGDGTDEARDLAVEAERERQQAIAECMADQGFDYIPIDPEAIVGGESERIDRGSDEWIATYGFGITTQWFSQAEVGPDLVGRTDAPPDDTAVDPNQAIIATMSFSEQDAYYAARYGDQQFPELDEAMSEDEIDALAEGAGFQPGGCEVQSANDGATAFYAAFGEELDVVYERARNDSRVVAVDEELAACVADKGHSYRSQDAIHERFNGELASIEASMSFPGDDLTEEDFSSLSAEELDEIFSRPRGLSDDGLAALGALQAEEVGLAVVVSACGGFATETALFQEVLADYEQQFLDDNADRIAEFEADR